MWELNKLIPICVVDEGRVKRERGETGHTLSWAYKKKVSNIISF